MNSDKRLVIISGLSGSGKSVVLNAFEDLDYYAIDNLPIKLFEKFVELISSGSEFSKIALVMDIRDVHFVESYPLIFRRVVQQFPGAEILFFEASDEVLVRRFSETRRKHPLSSNSVAEGIKKERKVLSDLKELATTVIDTSAMDVHSLKRRITEQFAGADAQKMQIRLVSFGFKNGTPKNCDLQFDVRFLQNPHFVPELREFSGRDEQVKNFVKADPRTREFLDRTLGYIEFLVPQYAIEGKSYLSIGIGCTGGKHRSVAIAEWLTEELRAKLGDSFPISLEHQDLSS